MGISKITSKFVFVHYFLVAFFLTISFINRDVRGVIWLTGAMISTLISAIIITVLGKENEQSCESDGYSLSKNGMFKNVALPGNIITYTLSYLLFPMTDSKKINPIIISLLVLCYLVSGYEKMTNNKENCTTGAKDVILVGLIGLAVGYFWYKILKKSGNNRLYYYSEFLSNNVVCNKPEKTQFKCKVYKNGELIANL
jgi:hypothetical protein